MSGIPDALAAFAKQAVWVAWNDEGGRKVPKSPRGGNAKSNDPTTWGTYTEAAEAVKSRGYSGVGIMLSNGLVGIDLDDVVGDGGEIDGWAREIIDGIDSYAEVSPSGSGVHVLAYADPTATGAIGRADHAKGVEVYNHGRYFTVTGEQLGESGIVNRTSEVLRLLERHFMGESPEDKLRRSVGAIARDQVRRRGNQTTLHNAKRNKLRYARVPMGGETCTFCMMLASRGFVYHSAQTAGEGNHYHHDCRCKAVPGFDGIKVEGYDPDKYAELYYDSLATDAYGLVDLRGTLRNMGKANAKARNARRRELYAKSRGVLQTAADPARDVIGSAEDTHPERLSEILGAYKKDGVEIRWHSLDGEAMGYIPPMGRLPAQVHLTEGMSILAHEHEFTHHEMCRESGLGYRALVTNKDLRWEYEEAAYAKEMQMAKELGYNELVEKYQDLMEAERRRIYGE